MTKATCYFFKLIFFLSLCFFVGNTGFAQVELQPWGNISGIRIDGQLMEFETNITVVKNNWKSIAATGKERQRPKYIRNGNEQIVTTNIDSLYFVETVSDAAKGTANVKVQLTSKADVSVDGVYFTLSLPKEFYADGKVQINDLKPVKLSLAENSFDTQTNFFSIKFISAKRQLTITFKQPTAAFFKSGKEGSSYKLWIPLSSGNLEDQQIIGKSFSIKASGEVDKKPIELTLNTNKTGKAFDGLGGNFRLQNPKTDPQVIDYCLENLDVRWSRVEMPWQLWQPEIDKDPTAEANAGRLNLHVKESMEMAQRLFKMKIPVILSAWSAPAWAVIGKPKYGPSADGVWGNPLDQTKTKEIYKSIADYIIYLKDKYDVEISMFSFNESDLGINVRQTGEEHAKLIKELGAYFISRGLKTKLLLGDNSDANSYSFILPALTDSATYPFIGAVSFHSWRGWENETLQKWANAATKLNRPLIIAEGSIDAQAWGYPAIFQEPTYALKEIDLYVKLLHICQPKSILQWQLTADYSPLSGGGIFGEKGPLRRTQRFWNLKQLSSTPEGLNAIQLTSDAPGVSFAALGNIDKNKFVIHLVNKAASREVTINGFPSSVHALHIFITNKNENMKEGKKVMIREGKAKFTMPSSSFITLISE